MESWKREGKALEGQVLSRPDAAEERISELKGISVDTLQTDEQRGSRACLPSPRGGLETQLRWLPVGLERIRAGRPRPAPHARHPLVLLPQSLWGARLPRGCCEASVRGATGPSEQLSWNRSPGRPTSPGHAGAAVPPSGPLLPARGLGCPRPGPVEGPGVSSSAVSPARCGDLASRSCFVNLTAPCYLVMGGLPEKVASVVACMGSSICWVRSLRSRASGEPPALAPSA